VQERTRAIVSDLDIPDDRLAETALRFVLGEPTVSTVIPRDALGSQRRAKRRGGGLSPEHRDALRAHRWVRNFYR
jgi:hypothetical protein